MSRDANSAKRDSLIIPGGLILIYGAAAVFYAEQIRQSSDFCPDGSWILVNSVCYTVWKLALPILLVAEALVLIGAFGFRGKPKVPEKYLEHGSGPKFVLSFLISLMFVSGGGLLIQLWRENAYSTTYVLEAYGVPFRHVFLLALTLVLATFAFLPYFGLYVAANVRRRKFLKLQGQDMEADLEDQEDDVDEAAFAAPDGEAWPDERKQTRCAAITKAGERCKLKTMPEGAYCSVHHAAPNKSA